jgi:hypothetical protein
MVPTARHGARTFWKYVATVATVRFAVVAAEAICAVLKASQCVAELAAKASASAAGDRVIVARPTEKLQAAITPPTRCRAVHWPSLVPHAAQRSQLTTRASIIVARHSRSRPRSATSGQGFRATSGSAAAMIDDSKPGWWCSEVQTNQSKLARRNSVVRSCDSDTYGLYG